MNILALVYFTACRVCAYQMVHALQVVLVVQEVQENLFLENQLNQAVQEVLVVPCHLILTNKQCYTQTNWAYSRYVGWVELTVLYIS